MKKLTAILVILFWIFTNLSVVSAQNPSPTSDLVLSEIFYDADGTDDGMEWVELYNRGNSTIDLSNYSLGNGGTDYTYSNVQLSGTIAPHSFIVVGGPTSNSTNYNPTYNQVVNFDPDFQNGGTASDGVALFNVPASEVNESTVPIDVVIYDEPNSNNLINTTGYTGSVDVADASEGKSIERTNVNTNEWHIQDNPNPNSSPYQSTIPVELTSFTAAIIQGKVILQWITQTETENLGFHVYRSRSEPGNYIRMSQKIIPGAGSTDESHHYSYTDKNIESNQTYYYKLADVDFNGNINFHGPISVTVNAQPSVYSLSQNYPNPFNSSTAINFSLKEKGTVTLKIYNLQGQLIRTIVNEEKSEGNYTAIWDGIDESGNKVASNVYLYTLQINEFKQTKKLIFLK